MWQQLIQEINWYYIYSCISQPPIFKAYKPIKFLAKVLKFRSTEVFLKVNVIFIRGRARFCNISIWTHYYSKHSCWQWNAQQSSWNTNKKVPFMRTLGNLYARVPDISGATKPALFLWLEYRQGQWWAVDL